MLFYFICQAIPTYFFRTLLERLQFTALTSARPPAPEIDPIPIPHGDGLNPNAPVVRVGRNSAFCFVNVSDNRIYQTHQSEREGVSSSSDCGTLSSTKFGTRTGLAIELIETKPSGQPHDVATVPKYFKGFVPLFNEDDSRILSSWEVFCTPVCVVTCTVSVAVPAPGGLRCKIANKKECYLAIKMTA